EGSGPGHACHRHGRTGALHQPGNEAHRIRRCEPDSGWFEFGCRAAVAALTKRFAATLSCNNGAPVLKSRYMETFMIRRIFAVLLSTLVLFGCSRTEERSRSVSAEDDSKPVQGDWAVIRYEAEPDTLNPILRTTALASYVISGANNSQIYE